MFSTSWWQFVFVFIGIRICCTLTITNLLVSYNIICNCPCFVLLFYNSRNYNYKHYASVLSLSVYLPWKYITKHVNCVNHDMVLWYTYIFFLNYFWGEVEMFDLSACNWVTGLLWNFNNFLHHVDYSFLSLFCELFFI